MKMKLDEDSGIRIENVHVEDRKPPSCCMCLDVRIGTVLIGLFYLVVHSAWLVVATSSVINRKALIEPHVYNEWDLNNLDDHQNFHKHAMGRHMVGMIIACLCFVVVVLLIYGAALRRARYILPFFCLQVFDMSLTILVAATTASYAHKIKLYMESTEHFQDHRISHMSLSHFRLVLVTFFLIMLSIKYYMMSVVWACYKHSRSLEDRAANTEVNPTYLVYQGNMNPMVVLPTYDEVAKSTPPPAYTR